MALQISVLDGGISDLLKSQKKRIIFEYEPEKIWNPNGVSLQKRLTDKTFARRVNKVLTPDNIKKYIIEADSQAPSRCVDGRMRKNWDKQMSLQDRPLGPKIAGGTAHAALTHRVVEVDNLREDLHFEEDIKYVIKKYKAIGIGFGGHIDDHQSGWNTGCGAVDNINLILERVQRPEPQEQLRGLARLVLGDAYDITYANEIIGLMLFLDALKPSYMPKEGGVASGEFLYKKTIVDTIRTESNSANEPVEELVGKHNEVGVILNFVHGTTFDSDRFGFDNGGEIQLFGFDVWEILDEAHRLYPYSMFDERAKQQKAIANRQKHIITRTLLTIATLMVLTDGSIRVIVAK